MNFEKPAVNVTTSAWSVRCYNENPTMSQPEALDACHRLTICHFVASSETGDNFFSTRSRRPGSAQLTRHHIRNCP